MTGGGRFVVLGLAVARSPWFRAVAQWSNSASIPVEFVKCMSSTEVRAHLSGGRPFSALVVDGGAAGVDRDLLDEARTNGCAVVVVDGLRPSRDWRSLGASAVVNPLFERDDLLEILEQHGARIDVLDDVPGEVGVATAAEGRSPVSPARLAMVCGPGGTGASTVAVALAQGLADDLRYGRRVLLADLCLRAEQAMLHDVRDVVPSIQELVEAHRSGRPAVDDLRRYTFDIQERRYQLLLGLRRPRDWHTLRPRAFAAAFHSLRVGWRAVVCDTTADLEGQEDTTSADVEDRNLLSRTTAARADVVFVVGRPGMKGIHALVRVVADLLDHGVPSERIVPVVNVAPKAGRPRADLARAVAALLAGRPDAGSLPSPLFLPERPVDDAFRDGVRLPAVLSAPLAAAFDAVADHGPRPFSAPEPQPVVPGTVGSWSPGAVGGGR